MTSERSDEAWEEGAEDALGAIVPVRSELAGGDRRLLYLAWLVSVDAGEVSDHGSEPPVPPGLGALSVSLQRVVEFLRIDEDLLWAAAQASEPLRPIEPSAADLTQWVVRLPDHEKDELLGRLISGEPHLPAELTRRFRTEHDPVGDAPGGRTVANLREAARRHAEQRDQLVAQRRADEQARRDPRPIRIHVGIRHGPTAHTAHPGPPTRRRTLRARLPPGTSGRTPSPNTGLNGSEQCQR